MKNDNEDARTFASSLIKKFEKLSTLSKKDVADFSKTLKLLKNTSQVADNISSNLNIQIFEKQKLLELNDVKKRLEKFMK